MKRYSLFLLLIGLLLSSCFSGSSLLFMESESHNIPNLLVNASFEKADKLNPGSPLGWYMISSTEDMKEPVAIDSTICVSGKHSLRIDKSAHNLYLVSDAFKINYTGGYYIKGSIRSAQAMRKPAKFYFWAYDAAGNKKNTFQRSVKGKQEWRKAEISAGFLKNPVTFARIAVFIPKDAANTIWLDDFGVYLVHRFTTE